MRQNWYITCQQNFNKEIIEATWHDAVRWLEQDIAAIIERQDATVTETGNEVRPNVGITPHHKRKVYSILNQLIVQARNTASNFECVGVIDAWEHVRGACHHADAVINSHTSHVESRGDIPRPVVNSWQDVAVKIYHYGSGLQRHEFGP